MLVFIAIEGPLVWLVASVTIIFARHVYIGYEQTGLWQESWWPALAVWVPFYMTLAFSVWTRMKIKHKGRKVLTKVTINI
jgi:hypothetical protein